MARLGLGFGGLLRGVRHATLLRHKRSQRRTLAEQPGNATARMRRRIAVMSLQVADIRGRANQGYDDA